MDLCHFCWNAHLEAGAKTIHLKLKNKEEEEEEKENGRGKEKRISKLNDDYCLCMAKSIPGHAWLFFLFSLMSIR